MLQDTISRKWPKTVGHFWPFSQNFILWHVPAFDREHLTFHLKFGSVQKVLLPQWSNVWLIGRVRFIFSFHSEYFLCFHPNLSSRVIFFFQGKGQRRVTTLHILDAVFLCGTDVRELHFNDRLGLSSSLDGITRRFYILGVSIEFGHMFLHFKAILQN